MKIKTIPRCQLSLKRLVSTVSGMALGKQIMLHTAGGDTNSNNPLQGNLATCNETTYAINFGCRNSTSTMIQNCT